MTVMRFAWVSALLLIACSNAFARDCKSDMHAFLQRPEAEQYKAIAGRKPCRDTVDASDADNDAMAHLIAQGNTYAARFMVDASPDTGEGAEDLNIMLGYSAKTHPELVLGLLAQGKITQSMFYDVLRATGEKSVDDMPAQQRELKKRLQAIEKLHDPALKDEQNLAIDYLTSGNLPTKYLPETLICPVKPCH